MCCTTYVRKGNQHLEFYNAQNLMLNKPFDSIHIHALTIIFHPLNPNVAADTWTYFHFKYPSVHEWDGIFSPHPYKVTFNGTWAVCLANKG
jgi:hypothetical protein